jgi:hypothetical protein
LTQNNGISVSNMLVDRAAGHVGFWCDRIVIPEHRIAIREPVALSPQYLLNELVANWRRGVENEVVITERVGKSADDLATSAVSSLCSIVATAKVICANADPPVVIPS